MNLRLKCLMTPLLLFSTAALAQSAEWSYSAPDGPAQWGNLPGYTMCAQGADQSPIAIESGKIAGLTNVTLDPQLHPPLIEWSTASLQLFANGHTLQEIYAPGSQATFEGQTYPLKQFHFHSPSEHLIDEQQFPLEAHFVHQTPQGQTLVIGVMFKEGAENQELKTLWAQIPAVGQTITAPQIQIDATTFLPHDQAFFTYGGSLTTPPCTEGVTWIVIKSPIEASKSQLQTLQKALGFTNNRPVQPLDHRIIRTNS